eukprot:5075875-Alexandrium_andersonii.AAC.1
MFQDAGLGLRGREVHAICTLAPRGTYLRTYIVVYSIERSATYELYSYVACAAEGPPLRPPSLKRMRRRGQP